MEDKYLVQSTKYSKIRNNFGLYAQRLLVLLANAMQYRYENANLRTGVIPYSEMQLKWTFKIADLKFNDSNNIPYIKQQLKKAVGANVEMQIGKEWSVTTLYTKITLRTEQGELDVELNKDLWDLFVEISKGFKRYQLGTAMQFSSAHALRLYQLLAGNTEPITYSIEYLKKMFGVDKKYELTKDFIARCIQSPIEEINKTAEYNVKYEPIYKSSGKGRPSIDALRFTVRSKPKAQNQNAEIVRKYGLSLLPDALKVKLIESYNFTKQGIKANAELLQEAYSIMKEPTLMEFLDNKRAKAMKAKNPQGWIINAIAGEIETLE